MKPTNVTKKSPGRTAMRKLDESPRSLGDYSKLSPVTQTEPQPAVILNLAKKR